MSDCTLTSPHRVVAECDKENTAAAAAAAAAEARTATPVSGTPAGSTFISGTPVSGVKRSHATAFCEPHAKDDNGSGGGGDCERAAQPAAPPAACAAAAAAAAGAAETDNASSSAAAPSAVVPPPPSAAAAAASVREQDAARVPPLGSEEDARGRAFAADVFGLPRPGAAAPRPTMFIVYRTRLLTGCAPFREMLLTLNDRGELAWPSEMPRRFTTPFMATDGAVCASRVVFGGVRLCGVEGVAVTLVHVRSSPQPAPPFVTRADVRASGVWLCDSDFVAWGSLPADGVPAVVRPVGMALAPSARVAHSALFRTLQALDGKEGRAQPPRVVYHGTSADSARLIQRDGFWETRGMGGDGVCLAEFAKAADRYAARCGKSGELLRRDGDACVVRTALLARRLATLDEHWRCGCRECQHRAATPHGATVAACCDHDSVWRTNGFEGLVVVPHTRTRPTAVRGVNEPAYSITNVEWCVRRELAVPLDIWAVDMASVRAAGADYNPTARTTTVV